VAAEFGTVQQQAIVGHRPTETDSHRLWICDGMVQTLSEYADSLAARQLRWPLPPKSDPVSATPYLKPLSNIRVVLWDVYGTLLRISDGQLLHVHPQEIRMEVALDKTLQEFNLWMSMSRKPGEPWRQLQGLYLRAYDDLRLAGSGRKGDYTEVNSARLWRKVLDKIDLKTYTYDESNLGSLEQLSEKMALFFHWSLQGWEAADGAASTLETLQGLGFEQGLLADGQCFTLTQLLRGLTAQGTLPALSTAIRPAFITLSAEEGVRKPSLSLYAKALRRCLDRGVQPQQVLYVGSRLVDDLAVARSAGVRTAVYVGDKLSAQATNAQLRDPATKPDRLLTQLSQVRDLLGC
jgi:FMN phosphatase YigB (HAD superfamily)